MRSSATVEESAQYSFVGMFESYLNVRGADDLLRRVIALATHGLGGVARLLVGSVADKVIRGAPVPVLVVHPTAPDRRSRNPGPRQ